MEDTAHRAIAIVGVGAVLPDAPNAGAFWENIKQGRYSVTEVSRDRWDPNLYYDRDRSVPDKTYSKVGGWVREYEWDPIKWRLPIPPRVADAMDGGQKWAVACTRQVLNDYGYPARSLDLDRTAVILGNAMAGEQHYLTSLRIYFPEYARELAESTSFAGLPEPVRRDITRELHQRIARLLPEITEDTMPGELANCIAGRVANLFNFHGPNFTADAACASAMAAISAAADGLIQSDFDAAITGGIDRNMGATSFVKFCKIGALSPTGSRPYAEGADGFIMGEGAALFLMRRLADAERDGDKIYAVLRGIGASSDGKGKGITAPNPIGQKFCLERAWQNAGLSPATATLFEGHGTSTRVGDVVEVQSMVDMLSGLNLPLRSIALGSVKSNIGHLKGAAGAAGLLKATLALRDKVIPPTVNCSRPNPDIDFDHSPLYVNTELRPWSNVAEGARRVGVSAFGFGGTNFHLVLEEYIPHRLTGNGKRSIAIGAPETPPSALPAHQSKVPLRGALVIGAASEPELAGRLITIHEAAKTGRAPIVAPPAEADLRAAERIALDYTDAADLADKAAKALKALGANQPAMWKALRAQGIFRGSGPAPKVAFLYTGQGSQYVNMLRDLRAIEPIVAETFAEADRAMTPLLGKPLSEFIFIDEADPRAVESAENDLMQTAITQPAVLATDLALTRMLAAYGITPDMTMGHSLGEYGALVASGALPFAEALEAVSARGREMTRVSMEDNGRMAAVFAPLAEIERLLKTIDGYIVIANLNSNGQAVIGGATKAVEQAILVFLNAGYNAVPLTVSHAFHTSIVAPASEPLRRVLERLHFESPRVPIVTNVTGEFYPSGPGVVPQMLDILGRQIASPVQFAKGLRTLYEAGARVFVEVGPKKALHGFVEDVLGVRGDVLALFTNHPKFGDVASFNQALCGMYAAGLGRGDREAAVKTTSAVAADMVRPATSSAARVPEFVPAATTAEDRYVALGRMFADVLERGWQLDGRRSGPPATEPVAITGASLGLPGTERVFDDGNVGRLLRGEQLIDVIPTRSRRAMLDKHITRLVKSDNGGAFETIDNVAGVIKLAARAGAFDLEKEFGVSPDRIAALDRVTRLAIAAGIDALRDAGIPLVLRYKTTTKGSQLPERWGLPDSLRDDTGVIFASAFPGYDSFADETSRYYADRSRREQLQMLESLRVRAVETNAGGALRAELDQRLEELRASIEKDAYTFDRRFVFRVLPMGHSQFAEYIGARGPNTHVNAACASAAHAVAVAEDWIRTGRCRRVIIVSADDITTDNMIGWFGAGFLATGAAATDEVVEEAALPFDRRRHGMIMGMGAAAIVVESAEAACVRGIAPICEVLSAVTANSAFHGTRLDVDHISGIMEDLVSRAEGLRGFDRRQAAAQMLFVSHETYTPARGGSAAAEVHALRRVFGDAAGQIVIANTKGFTGHAMGAGVEDVVAIKALETGWVPPVANFKEVDPELGPLNLSKGTLYPIEYALRLGAGFGSQISMTLMRHVPPKNGVRPGPQALGYAGRIINESSFNAWISGIAGRPAAELEVVQRTLRVRDGGIPVRVAEGPGNSRQVARLDVTLPATPPPAPVTGEPAASAAPGDAAKWAVRVQVAVPAADPVKARVLELVSEKTGYPIDMLDLDLDLEADLGVDTVKQAEVFAAVREEWDVPRDENLKLRDFPTLAHVVRFVHERRPDLPGEVQGAAPEVLEEPESTAPASPAAPVTDAGDLITEKVLAIVAWKTGYPREMLDLDLDLEADLGIDTVKQAEMFASVREAFGIPRDADLKLRDFPTLDHVIRFARERSGIAAVAEPPVVEPPAAVAEEAAVDLIIDNVLAIVAEKTGYPREMLDLDLDLEADLGIDTVKQAEMFASVRAAFNIPRDADLKLRDFPTLAHVIQFARDRSGVAAAAPAVESEAPARPSAAPLDAANAVPRRVPVAELRPPLAMCKATGVTLGPGSRVVLMPDKGGAADALTESLRAKGVEILRIDPATAADALGNALRNWLAAGPVHGVYWLPALDNEGDLSSMELPVWREAVRIRVKALYTTMRVLYEQIATPSTFLIAATHLGGKHGYDEAGASAPLGGAVTGLAKAYRRERSEALVKAVDFDLEAPASTIADTLIAETLRDPVAVEIGYADELRWTVGLQEQPAADGQPGMTLDRNTVFVVTGAAGSIVSAITADLAAASGGTFYLLDLVAEPDPKDTDIARFTTDRDALRRDLFARIQARGERATPALVEKELARLERLQAARSAIEAVTAAGGTAHYFSVNLSDSGRVAEIIDIVRQRSGRIDVLLHAAGLDRSHFLPDKEPYEFDLVFDVKGDGWFNLLHAIGDMPLNATVAFSSIAGRFGNAGQTDYSAANDLLCKIASSFRRTRPQTRAIAIDWTAWGSIGMASRGSIPKMMELAGIDMLAPEAGIPFIRRELTAGGTRGEVVVAHALGILLSEPDASGGLDTTAVENSGERLPAHRPMVGQIAAMSLHRGLRIDTTLDPKFQPFLYDHQIDGTPVLPAVMGVEGFAEAASVMLPGWCIDAIEDVDFIAPFKFYRHEPRTVTIEAKFYPDRRAIIANCGLIGSRTLAGQSEPQVTTHFSGRVRLSREPLDGFIVSPPATSAAATISAAAIYRLYFHGPAYQVVEQAWWDGERLVGQMAERLPANHHPHELPTLIAPRLIELCLQTAGLWEMSVLHRMGLPQHIDKVRVWRTPEPGEARLYSVVTPHPDEGTFDAEVVDAAGNLFVCLCGYRTAALPGAVDGELLNALPAVMA